MSYAAELLQRNIRRVLYTQAALTSLVVVAFVIGLPAGRAVAVPAWLVGFSPEFYNGLSSAYGGAVAILSTWWLGRRVNAAGELARARLQAGQLALFIGLLQRLFGLMLLFVIAFALLRLSPLPLIVGFSVAHLGLLAATKVTVTRKNDF